ncbi:hypothetical protein E4T44_11105 [Aureobasidium sp. EXF-8845]|nr:hypothetical protein E4T45_10993 [Aureobasidium sp. EXF-8846]KAI4808843.1 hypothetical protein E4T44_11105 [Aureobasidium sp. EXF-8845]
MPLCGGTKTVQRKLVLLGDGACGKTSLLNVFTRGYELLATTTHATLLTCDQILPNSLVRRLVASYPRRSSLTRIPASSEPTVFENYVHDIFIDNVHVELSLWDTAGQEEFDRLRSLSYDDTHAIMLCFSVDSPDSLENVESKWVAEIAENCPGVKLVLVALKCDLREQANDDEESNEPKRPMIDYKRGLAVAEKIKALRYLGAECSAMKNRGVNEAFTEAARVALQVKNVKGDKQSSCSVM